tara:strand:+ start:253 stop:534 length:282 start_codon:yes stop_codon:yes gene_type:complete
MKIKAVPLDKFFSNKESIYKNIMIVSKRARQIISERYEEQALLNDIEDTDELTVFEDKDYDQEKSIAIAMQELLDKDLEYRNIEDDSNEESTE